MLCKFFHNSYGANIVEVFRKLRATKFQDIYKPAKEQFEGSGSYGNGGAMRIAPIALYFHEDEKAMLQAARKCTEITHTHREGINGALLQCLAVRQSLMIHPTDKVDAERFCCELIEKIRAIEVADYADGSVTFNHNILDMQLEADNFALSLICPFCITFFIHCRLDDDETPYHSQMTRVLDFLCSKEDARSDAEIVKHLGTSIAALHSVPTAIYCFLRAQESIPKISVCSSVIS